MKVSVIVPVYNSETFLRDCLDSLVHQSLEDIEIIAVDDASTDKSFSILMEYAQKYSSKIKLYRSDSNKGQGASRNIGLALANGEYIGFVDSDDYVSPTMYEEMYDAAKNNAADIVATKLTFVRDSSHLGKNYKLYNRTSNYNPLINPELVLDESPSVCNKIFKKESLHGQEFLEDCMWEDVAFTYSNLFNASNVVHLNNMGYYYRKSPSEGVSAKGFVLNSHLLDTFRVADKLGEETKKTGRYEKLKPEITYMQMVTTLQRAAEVLSWDIPNASKDKIIYNIHKLILEKYGDWRQLDKAELSMRVGILELDKIANIVNSHDKYEISDPSTSVSEELTTLGGR